MVSAFGIGGVQVEGTPCDGNFIFGGGPNLALVCGRGADVSMEVPSERSVRSGVAGLSPSMSMLSSMSDSLSMRKVGDSAGGGLGAPCLGFGLGMFTSSSSVTAAKEYRQMKLHRSQDSLPSLTSTRRFKPC